MKFVGTAGNDVLTGTSGNDIFDLSQGGNDKASGGNGNDVFEFGDSFTAADKIDGGSGNDKVELAGDTTVTFTAATMVNVEKVFLTAGFDYSLTTNDATVASGKTLAVDGSTLGSLDTFVLNGSAETNGKFDVYGGLGNDTLTGGKGNDFFDGWAGNDTFNLSKGGNDTVEGDTGTDTISAGAALTAADSIDGGTGTDTVNLSGNYGSGVTFGATTLTNVENLILAAGHNYKLTTNDATVASGATLTVDAHALGASNTLTFNASAETDGSFDITGGKGNDVVTFANPHAWGIADYVGGAGKDTVVLDGNFGDFGDDNFVGVDRFQLTSVETVKLTAGHTYALIVSDIAGTGGKLIIDATATTLGDYVVSDNVTEHLIFKGGAHSDAVFGGEASDTLTGGGGADIFGFDMTHPPSGTTYDTVTDLDFAQDNLFVNGDDGAIVPSAIDPMLTAGALSQATFMTDLAAAVNSGVLDADAAIIFKPDSGDLGTTHHAFLIVDCNSTAGFQAGADLVVDITGYTGALATTDFIST